MYVGVAEEKFLYLPYCFVVFGCIMSLMFVHMESRCRHVSTACRGGREN